jgi:chorismate-pyruvate lyase
MTAASATGEASSDSTAGAAGDFDPAAGVFVAQHARPPALAPVDMAALTPLQRGLLVTDGTVTKFLEAYALEPVDVLRLDQATARLAAPDPWLDLVAGAPVIHRQVMLCGRRSGRFFAWADSRIVAERLSPAVRKGLDTERGGLGQILVNTGAETRRQCLWYGREARGGAPPRVLSIWPGDFLTRSYRVLTAGRPMMLITEHFPI